MEKKISDLLAAQREISGKMVNASEEEMKSLQSAYDANKREIEMLNQAAVAERNAPKAEKKTLVSQIREAMKTNQRSITVTATHDHTVDNEMQGLLEPLYANSALSQLGVRWYTGAPKGDLQIPIMGAGTVGWASEIAQAAASGNTFTSKKLSPKRLTAYVDISKQFLLQDTIGAEAAVRRDIVNAINDKLEATIFGAAADADAPTGMFNNQTPTLTDTFDKVCELEATVENANVTGNMKYLLSPKAKSNLRAMAKSSKNTQLVYEGGTVDGVPAVVTSNVNPATAGAYIYGDFSNLAVASWGDIDITIDEYTQAVNGCVRLVVNAYFDAEILRPEAFAFGKTRTA